MQNFSDLVQEEHSQNWGWMERSKNCAFSTENWQYIGNSKR